LDAETHKPFKNPGDCVNNGAKGEDSEYLFIDPSPYDCPPPMTGACWGTLDGQGLSAGEQWQVFFPADLPPPNGTTPFRTGTADDSGNIGASLNLPCGQGATNAYAIAPDDNISDTSPSPHALRIGPPLEPHSGRSQGPSPRRDRPTAAITLSAIRALVRRATTVAHMQPPASGSLLAGGWRYRRSSGGRRLCPTLKELPLAKARAS
jgi:hypothetical protein